MNYTLLPQNPNADCSLISLKANNDFMGKLCQIKNTFSEAYVQFSSDKEGKIFIGNKEFSIKFCELDTTVCLLIKLTSFIKLNINMFDA
jgi:hypothetical protein